MATYRIRVEPRENGQAFLGVVERAGLDPDSWTLVGTTRRFRDASSFEHTAAARAYEQADKLARGSARAWNDFSPTVITA